ncbi:DNA helicase [Crocosphaera subtropica ATCC 51142]|uniref:DNA helicase n=1 Tax=Crocosphaera subtropica (strain ATCC 51142 / BH68) TaxID=43989 RepID=B1WQH4_CROS5|nr:DEAD/DEAH box helicase [Crocosphaera subtropica]ACB51685.1 DNA helicase [Crocosphaera subtropica ATCC 51142]
MKESLTSPELNIQNLFPFQLDSFQEEAIAALNQGKSVVVCAPTGSGKTVIGEFATYRALHLGQRVFYTTPLKALSNQKFRDFQEKFATTEAGIQEDKVGLITGDMVINPNADIVIMTTEIFRNMLYETPIGQVGTSLENVATVILDECHYISDRGRGTVWEESIIYCPPTIQLVALSATIGNPEELTDWINQVRKTAPNVDPEQTTVSLCELINSDFRPVPLRFYFSQKNGLYPLLNRKQTALNPRLKPKGNRQKRKRIKRSECPTPMMVVEQLDHKDLLPAIYVIFSRRECDRAVQKLEGVVLVSPEEAHALQYNLLTFFLGENPNLQESLLKAVSTENPPLYDPLKDFLSNLSPQSELFPYLAADEDSKIHLFQILADLCQLVRGEQLEPLTRGIAAHHAGILPLWKELVEQLFEVGLVKVVFATATLSAGINMPARTTVISALSKRTDTGHSMLTPSEFLQIAGRAGRRGMDEVGYVVTIQTPFEGATEAAYLATAESEPLRSCFTPSYGMVLNLLQKHTIQEAKDLLERSFAEYLAQLKLEPEQQAIADLSTELAKLDIELGGLQEKDILEYEKLNARLKEEKRLIKILEDQAEEKRKKEISGQLGRLNIGDLVYLKGKRLRTASPQLAVIVAMVPGSGQSFDLLCLGDNNYWYLVKRGDIVDFYGASLPLSLIDNLPRPDQRRLSLGRGPKGDETSKTITQQISDRAFGRIIPPEVVEQQKRIDHVQGLLNNHPLTKGREFKRLLKSHHQRLELREQLHNRQIKFQKLQSNQSYYWQEFLNLIDILREFDALDDYTPTKLGKAAATMRGENELWLGLVFMSGILNPLEPHQLAAAVSAIITETLRPDTWTNYLPSPEVLRLFRESPEQGVSIGEMRRLLNQTQRRYQITIPVWLELELIGLVEQWALGGDWQELCENTSLDEGDLVRLLRRTIDLLWQIPQTPGISNYLAATAKEAIVLLKRFPI